LPPRFTVRAAVRSIELKSAIASVPLATLPPLQLLVVPHVELELTLLQVPSSAGAAEVKSRMLDPKRSRRSERFGDDE
jgi:hypothetical protein